MRLKDGNPDYLNGEVNVRCPVEERRDESCRKFETSALSKIEKMADHLLLC